MDSKKIVIVQKDKILKSILELFIEQLEYEVVASFFSFTESAKYVLQNEPDVLIIDLNVFENRISIRDYVEEMENLECPIIFIGNADEVGIAKKMVSFNLYSFMSKPVSKNILRINIEIALAKHGKIHKAIKADTSDDCETFCFTNHKGIITKVSPSFSKTFGVSEEVKGIIELQSVFPNNQEFVKFDDLVALLKIDEHKSSLFLHKNHVFDSLIFKKEEHIFKICFREAIFEKQIALNNQVIEARFNSLYDNCNESVLIFDAQNGLIKSNIKAEKRYKKILKDDLYTGMSIYEVLHFIPEHEVANLIESVHIPSVHKLNKTVFENGECLNFEIQLAPILSAQLGSIGGFILTARETTELNELKKEISTLKDELKPVYESTIQRFYLTDLNKKLVAFNESAFKTIQQEYNHTLQKGDNVKQFVPSEIGEKQFDIGFQRALEGEHISFKTKIHTGREEIWNEVHYEPVINENGDLNRVLIWTLDITESERNLIALDESNKRYELVAKGGNDGLWDWDLRNNDVFLSPRWKSLLGYEEDEIQCEFGTRDSLTHPDDKLMSEKILKRSLENGSDIFQNEIRLLCKDQNYKWVLERGIILRDENGKPYRMAGSITDITDRKETEVTLLQLNRSLLEERAMFIKGNVGIIRVNAEDLTKVSYISDNSLELTGYTPREFYDSIVPLKHIIHPEDVERHRKEREDAINSNKTHIEFSDYRFIKKDGNIIWIKDFTTITRDEDGNVKDLLGYFIDISESKRVELEYENIQNMFSALWQAIKTEAFIIHNSGKILFCNNKNKYNLKQFLEKDQFIFDIFSSLDQWANILENITQEPYQYSTKQYYNDKEIQLDISKIDNEKFLILSNLEI